jgi:enoyl-[acyl-carrier protein] reductase III
MNIIITGGSRGIGRAIALRLAKPGRTVLINYLQNQEAAEQTAEDVRAQGAQAVVVQGNVRSDSDLKRIAGTLPSVDVLVHNAAVGALKPYDKLRSAHWDLTMESSLKPFWHLTKLAPLAEGASVIGLSSLGSRRYIPGYAAMGAAKAGMEALTRQLAVELAPKRVRVNSVCGGLVQTDALQYFPEREQMINYAEQATPFGRLGTPDDIAAVVELLVSDAAGWITGQTIVADGGLSLI